MAASEAHAMLAFDTTLVVPAAQQPFKNGSSATPEQRLDMVRLAVEGDERFEVSTVDIDRGEPTYTIDTVRDIEQAYPDAELFFVTGADSLATLDRWKDAQALRERVRFVGVTRAGHSLPEEIAGVTLVEVPHVRVSSTEVRARIARGMSVRYLVPHPVETYIREHHLYGGGTDG